MTRTLLHRQITAAWHSTMHEVYSKQLINSERGLQVHFCSRLLAEFKELPRRIFIEPSFRDGNGKVRSPDIVVCHTQQIIGVIELKYQPRVQPDYVKDIGTLSWFAESSTDLALSNKRYLGVDVPGAERCYTLAPDAILCWAGVYRGPPVDIEAKGEALRKRFLGLHAVTSHGKDPDVLPKTAGQ